MSEIRKIVSITSLVATILLLLNRFRQPIINHLPQALHDLADDYGMCDNHPS